MAIVNMLLPAAWYDKEIGEWVEAIVFVDEGNDSDDVVIEPRLRGDVQGFRLSRDEWEELQEFIEGEFERFDLAKDVGAKEKVENE